MTKQMMPATGGREKLRPRCRPLPYSKSFKRNPLNSGARLFLGFKSEVFKHASHEIRRGFCDVLGVFADEPLDGLDFAPLRLAEVVVVQLSTPKAFTSRDLLAELVAAGCRGGCVISDNGMARDEDGKFLYFRERPA